MTYDQLVSQTQSLLIIPANESQITAIIQNELNSAQQDFVQLIISNYKNKVKGFEEIGNFLPGLISQADILTVAGQSQYTLNSDVELLLSLTLDEQPVSLIEMDNTWMETYRPSYLPTNRWVTARRHGETLFINPTQLDGLLLRYYYVAEPETMSTGDVPQIAPEHHHRLIYYAAYMAAKLDLEVESRYTADYLMEHYLNGLIIQKPEKVREQ